MGRMRPMLVAAALGVALAAAPNGAPVAAFDRFGASTASAVYGGEMRFEVELIGGAPERLELLLRFGEDEVVYVHSANVTSRRGVFVIDTAEEYIPPNTPIRYQWRSIDDGSTTLSAERTIVHDDDRPALDWQVLESGEVRTHWYAGDRALIERLSAISADAVERAEDLFGGELTGGVDVFAYSTREEFRAAIAPGQREWVGGQTSPGIRTVYIWLQGGSSAYLERLVVHEITHMVFDDATRNAFHTPATWLDEGLALWSETQGAGDEWPVVQQAAGAGELLAFDAIAEQFPVDRDEAILAYSQGATLIDAIIRDYGAQAIAGAVAAYREGATDAEAVEAGTGVPLETIIEDWFADLGHPVPQPVEPVPLLPAVGAPSASGTNGPGEPVGEGPAAETPAPERDRGALGGFPGWLVPALVVAIAAAGIGLGWEVVTRSRTAPAPQRVTPEPPPVARIQPGERHGEQQDERNGERAPSTGQRE